MFTDVDLCGADLSKSLFLKSKLVRANFTESTLDDCRFNATQAAGTRFTGARATRLAFLKSELNGCRFDGAQIELRASWSPGDADMKAHVEGWGELLCMLAGLPPVGEGVSVLRAKRSTRD